MSDDAAIQQQLDHEMNRLFQHFEQDEERTTRLAAALEQESTAAALHFALFPRKTRDGGLQPTCREPVVSMMAFVVDIFSPHDGSVDLRVLSECFIPTCEEGEEGIVGLSYQYKDEQGNTIHISRGKVKDAKRQFAHQVQLRLCLPCNPNISVKVFKTGRLQIAGCKDEGTCNKIVRHVIDCLNRIQARPDGRNVFERHLCEPSGQHVAIEGPIEFDAVVTPETVNINCTFDAGYSFVGYTLDPLALKSVVGQPQYATCVKSVEYTPEKRYAGVKVLFRPPQSGSGEETKAKREVFIGIFPSSKTVITGAVNWAEVDDAYDFASRLLLQNFEAIRKPIDDAASRRSRQRVK
mmetsp:Transcript_25353/g.51631  ORF Transcript_25353/g.51631 Transcript_25353/m.51631 type:complete len:351 (-) Transcript_25353:142-1194(-)|eukprot:CAMPEP_0196739988 /NCGR_PEP_ID=MMETSP1091-20130531/27871_1 /TAXON_ID=302021 /ORGANISM="Rhodomonas sp., Strain CCMP768" /LENGTH=350 /DNA_ID=CAMNT_0042084867 /DNA_START=112 /DNA_END=1164 /DNA_ORIENTATION=+